MAPEQDDSSLWLAGSALAVAALALRFGAGAFLRARRTTKEES
ncbi:hypothetical protein [Amycolatopsis sp. lyj-108]